MNLALDIDGTITAHPDYFSELTRQVQAAGGNVHIVSSRSPTPEAYRVTESELAGYGIIFDTIHFIPEMGQEVAGAPGELDWYRKYLWQKIDYCRQNGIDVCYDDDEIVIELFEAYAKEILACKVGSERPCAIELKSATDNY